ncbi:MAG: alanine racemase [Lautropia sp.]|nr:alanine racemase [Lautropia sp.]
MPRKLTATLSPAAMAHNLHSVRRRAPGARIWAVVKADAYGHGLDCALRGLAGADGMALLEFAGAARLRQLGWHKPVLMLEGPFDADDVAQARAQHLALAVHQPWHLQALATPGGPPVDVWLKISTGLNRLGVEPGQAGAFVQQLLAIPGVRLRGVMTHFANADLPGGASPALGRFDTAVSVLEQLLRAETAPRAGTARLPAPRPAPHADDDVAAAPDGHRPLWQSLANSAAIFRPEAFDPPLPAVPGDWIRPGIALYGASPFADVPAARLGLQPAMRLHGTILAERWLSPGEATGYGSLFVAPHPIRIGIVDCGYADGYPRVATTGTPVAIDGVRSRLLGRVSMDMLAVDLSPVPAASVGTPVELWGEQIPVDEVAAHAGTIGYELLCAIAPRVRREVTDAPLLSVFPPR